MTDPQIEAAAEALWQAECMRAASKPRNITWEDAGSKVHETWRFMARAALEAAEAVAWRPIAEAPRDGTVVDVWLGDAEPADVDFYCTPGTRRAPAWHWLQGKWRPALGLNVMTVFVQPTHYRNLPEPPIEGGCIGSDLVDGMPRR